MTADAVTDQDLLNDYKRTRIRLKASDDHRAERAEAALRDLPPMIGRSVLDAHDHYASDTALELLPGFYPRRGTGNAYGPSGEGKSLFIIYRNLKVANGQDVFGSTPTERLGSVYVPFEDVWMVPWRYIAAASFHGLAMDGCRIVTDARLNVLNEESVDTLVAVIEAEKAALEADGFSLGFVTLDTQRWIHPGRSSNDDDVTSAVTAVLKTISEKFACVADVVVHVPHQDRSRETGNSEQIGSRDVRVQVDNKTVTLKKHRFVPHPKTVGHFKVVSHFPVDCPTTDGLPVFVETDAMEAAVSVTKDGERVLDIGFDATEKDQKTAVEIIDILDGTTEAMDDGKRKGWNNTEIVRACEARRARPDDEGGPVDIHKHRGYIVPILEQLEKQGVIIDLSETRNKGKAREWTKPKVGQLVS